MMKIKNVLNSEKNVFGLAKNVFQYYTRHLTEAATRGVLCKKVFLEIS